MKLATQIRNILYEPGVRALDVDGSALVAAHKQIIKNKPLLRSAFQTFYLDMIDANERLLNAAGVEIELGSGVGFIKLQRPNVITSDIRPLPVIDRVIDAQQMELSNESVRCIFAINVFHHLPNPHLFFSELCRVLKPGGGCILVEPHNGMGSRLLHQNLHKDEHFDPEASLWVTEEIRGPLSGANQALAHIVFQRDKALFEERYGSKLEVVELSYCLNALRYLFSGGLNFRQLLPSFTEPLLRAIEKAGKPWAQHWSFHQMIVLRKR